jgi:ubiquitin carboxyl-terminal hydrolase 8
MITGLANIGNTCFLNSTLQCLLHLNELNIILNQQIPTTLLLKEYNDLRLLMFKNYKSVSPNRFVHVIHHICKEKKMVLFSDFHQNDVSEFLQFMLDELHISMKQEMEVNIPLDLNKVDKICYEMIQRLYSKDYSSIKDLFCGIEVSTVKTPTETIINAEPFLILNLPVKSCTTIYECLQLYTKEEQVDYKTTESVIAYKQLQFWKLPTLLFITLKRFDNFNKKLNHFIDIPKQITIDSIHYELIYVCNHYGNVQGGHYNVILRKNNEWIGINDNTVVVISENNVITPNVYCLLFRKI